MEGSLTNTMKGGTKEFNWDNVRNMSYKDRECFLGYTTKIGYLDKGGKWKKRDWWTKVDVPSNNARTRKWNWRRKSCDRRSCGTRSA